MNKSWALELMDLVLFGPSKLLFGSSIESEIWEVGGWRTDWWALGDLSRGRGDPTQL